MKARHLMTKTVASISKDKNVVEAAQVMRQNSCGSVVVVENEYPIGIITEKDLMIKVISEGRNPHEVSAGSIMTPDPITADVEDSISQTSRRMHLGKIRRMPVLHEDKLVGIISTNDIRRYMKDLEIDLIDVT